MHVQCCNKLRVLYDCHTFSLFLQLRCHDDGCVVLASNNNGILRRIYGPPAVASVCDGHELCTRRARLKKVVKMRVLASAARTLEVKLCGCHVRRYTNLTFSGNNEILILIFEQSLNFGKWIACSFSFNRSVPLTSTVCW